MLDGLLDVFGPVATDAVVVGGGQVVLGRGPIFREVLLRVNLQSLIVVLDGLLDVIGPVAPDAVVCRRWPGCSGSRPTLPGSPSGVDLQGLR